MVVKKPIAHFVNNYRITYEKLMKFYTISVDNIHARGRGV